MGVVALLASLGTTSSAYAGLVAKPQAVTQGIGSGQWGATPSTTSLPFGTQSTKNVFFTVANSGTLSLLGASYMLSGTSLRNNSTLSLSACVGGTWNQTTAACTGGTVVAITSTAGAAVTQAVTASGLFPAAAGASITLLASLDKTPTSTTVGSVTVTVDRSQVRAATVTYA